MNLQRIINMIIGRIVRQGVNFAIRGGTKAVKGKMAKRGQQRQRPDENDEG